MLRSELLEDQSRRQARTLPTLPQPLFRRLLAYGRYRLFVGAKIAMNWLHKNGMKVRDLSRKGLSAFAALRHLKPVHSLLSTTSGCALASPSTLGQKSFGDAGPGRERGPNGEPPALSSSSPRLLTFAPETSDDLLGLLLLLPLLVEPRALPPS